MNREDILRMARECGLHLGGSPLEPGLERFAALVAAAERDRLESTFERLETLLKIREGQPNKPCCLAEREACAKTCEHQPHWVACAAAIRARGEQS